jgi:hypothetical protein
MSRLWSSARCKPWSVSCWVTRWISPLGEVGSWPWSPAEQRRPGTRPPGRKAVLVGMIDPLRVIPGNRNIGSQNIGNLNIGNGNIGVDALATELVIDRRLAHGITP